MYRSGISRWLRRTAFAAAGLAGVLAVGGATAPPAAAQYAYPYYPPYYYPYYAYPAYYPYYPYYPGFGVPPVGVTFGFFSGCCGVPFSRNVNVVRNVNVIRNVDINRGFRSVPVGGFRGGMGRR